MLIGKYIKYHLTEVDSTNLQASAFLSANVIDKPTVIQADFQRKGKGQGNNSWESEAGMNLLLSLILFPKNVNAFEQFYLSKITAISVRELIAQELGSASIKWPNDILTGNEKIAGILIENALESSNIRSSIIGVGINVNQTRFQSFPIKATSIKIKSGIERSLQVILKKFIKTFDFWYEIFEDRDFSQINQEYLKFLFGFQKVLSFRKHGSIFNATLIDVEENGHLVLLMDNNRKQKFSYKELEFVMS